MLSLKKVILQIYEILWDKERYQIADLSSLFAQSVKNSFRFSYISFKVILYICKYCLFYRNDSCERKRRI